MTFRRTLSVCGRLTLLVAAAGCARRALNAPAAAVEPAAPATDGRALLVGVTVYLNLGEAYQLRGPANDVLLMKRLLIDKFSFSPENIVILSEEEGKKDPSKLPTRANIEREFTALGKSAHSGEQIVISMSGHGSQQPDRPDSKELKPDGMSEIFLPRDVGKWEDGKEAVANALLDHEVGHWLKPLQEAKASTWVVFDSCHSGTMTRGVNEVARKVPDDVLAVPREAVERARKRAAERNAASGTATRGGPAAKEPPITLASPGGVAALYACQPNEVTIERVPADSADAKSYGLLTYTINEVLNRSGSRPTYSELIQQVHNRYEALGRTAPTPMLEGGDRDREVLGQAVWKGRSRIEVKEGDAGLKITAGSLNGLTPGSVLAVYPPAGHGTADKPIGHVRVGKVGVYESAVEPCEYEKSPEPKRAELVGGRCEVVFVDYGDLRLRVAVDAADFGGKAVPEAERQKLTETLSVMEKDPKSLTRTAAGPADADWLVRWDAGRVYLQRASEWSAGRGEGKPASLFGPAEGGKTAEWLKASLEKIARAENLKRLTADSPEDGRGDDDASARIDVEVRLHKGEADAKGVPVDFARGLPAVYDGDVAKVHLNNTGHVPVDVTILYIDNGYGITSLFPDTSKNEDNRIPPGGTRVIRLDVNGQTLGAEHLVVIAVQGKGLNADFGSLEQPTIEEAKGSQKSRGRDDGRGLNSPLGKLLQNALYGEGGTRGVSRRHEANEYVLKCLTWKIEPGKRPGEGK